jgi:hypothetical protein
MTTHANAMTTDLYGLLFDVRRSVRYHNRRKGFYEPLHLFTNFLTIVMSGAVLTEMAKNGNMALWLTVIGYIAAFFAAMDLLIGYSKMANKHDALQRRFALLEMNMI